MPTFPLHLRHAQEAADQARQLVQIARDTDSPLVEKTVATAAGDERKLRGIPAIGRGVAGAVAFSSPHVHGLPREEAA